MKELDWANLPFGYMKTDYNVRIYYRNEQWGALEVCSSFFIASSSRDFLSYRSFNFTRAASVNLILDFKVLVRIIADLSVLVIFILKFCFLDFRLEDSCNLIGVHLYVF